jgi:ATP-dependent DNA ligase
MQLLEMLAKRELTGNAARAAQEMFWLSCTSLEAKWLQRVLNRDLRVRLSGESFEGVFNKPKSWEEAAADGSFKASLQDSKKNWNEVIQDMNGSSRATYTVEQAYELFKKKGCALASEGDPMVIARTLAAGQGLLSSPKIDGIRGFFIKANGQVKGYTRNAKELLTAAHIAEALQALPIDNVIFDGELIPRDQTWGNALSYVKSDKRFATDEAFRQEVRDKLQFAIFDLISLDEYMSLRFKETQMERYTKLSMLNLTGCLKLVEHVLVTSFEEIERLFEQALKAGWEGLVLKFADMPYNPRRSSCWMKKKPFKSIDAPITGFVEGQGRHVGRLGAFEVEYEGERFTVGSGFDDAERDKYWGMKDQLLGKMIEVRFQDDPQKVAKARFPIFMRMRADKDSN